MTDPIRCAVLGTATRSSFTRPYRSLPTRVTRCFWKHHHIRASLSLNSTQICTHTHCTSGVAAFLGVDGHELLPGRTLCTRTCTSTMSWAPTTPC
ncbi:hypothetical protein VTK26DRAFT_8912 [Humicola hyalothermophila]